MSPRKTSFSVWAPHHKKVEVEANDRTYSLKRTTDGYYTGTFPLPEGTLYRYRLNHGDSYPDPASRYQPFGPHGPSQVIDPRRFRWTDRSWRGITTKNLAIYELHLGTFTREGTFQAAIARLPYLKNLGVTAVELMPVAEFAGRWNWGYDGVNLFAPSHHYGHPDAFRNFVDRAHAIGLGVILDVVYNHLGPDGNYLEFLSKKYFSNVKKTDWGKAINFGGPSCEAVRNYYLNNASYWIREFHLDGLRFDATQDIHDASQPHILAQLSRTARKAAGQKKIVLVAENEPQDRRCVTAEKDDGFGVDAMWNDDFHHSAMVALTNFTEAYYTDYRGTPQELLSCLKRGFLYQGQWYAWQKNIRGRYAPRLRPRQLVCYLQNHDQVGNTLRGGRVTTLAARDAVRALTAAMFLGPQIPMIFMGQEFESSSPFPFFCDHEPGLGRLVSKGRRDFLAQFSTFLKNQRKIPYPQNPATFYSAKLKWKEIERHHRAFTFHRDLLKWRFKDATLASHDTFDGAVLRPPQSFVLRHFAPNHLLDRLVVVNLGKSGFAEPCSEPLLAAPDDYKWELAWSSDSKKYGGKNASSRWDDHRWFLPAQTTMLFRLERSK